MLIVRTIKTMCLFCWIYDSAQLDMALTLLSFREEQAHNRPFLRSAFLKFIKILFQQVEFGTQGIAFLTSFQLMQTAVGLQTSLCVARQDYQRRQSGMLQLSTKLHENNGKNRDSLFRFEEFFVNHNSWEELNEYYAHFLAH